MYAFIMHSEWSKLNLWSRSSFLGPVEHFQKVDELCQFSLWLLSVWHKNPSRTGRPRYGPNDNDQWSKVKRVQSMWLCILSGKVVESTFENTQWRKAKQMHPVWLCLLSWELTQVFWRDIWRSTDQQKCHNFSLWANPLRTRIILANIISTTNLESYN